jgi:Tfp pilus assembly protein PilX
MNFPSLPTFSFFRTLGNEPARGYVLLTALVFTAILFTISVGLITYTTQYARFERHAIAEAQALHIAEAGLDKAAYELNQNLSFTGEADVPLGEGTFTTSVETIDSVKRITSTAYIPNSADPYVTRIVRANLATDSNIIAFRYGIQIGNGGFEMSGNGTTVNGNVYSNGSIDAGTGRITGSAVASNLAAAVADQSNETPLPPAYDINFGNAASSEDFAKSFTLSQAYSFNSVQLYIKKVGTPSNATVRILYDNAGAPGSAVPGLTGTLIATQVTSSYGWVVVTLPTTPILTSGVTYWLIIDSATNASNYYVLGGNANGYANGAARVGKYGGTWNNTSPSGLDGYFKIYLGGQTSAIIGGTIGSAGTDLAWAHTVQNSSVTGPIYCQTGSGNNKSCDTSRADPDPQPMPLSDGNIQEWKTEAEAGGVINGDYTLPSDISLGPKKIDGDLTIVGKTLTVTGTLWVTGDIKLSGGATVQLDPSYEERDGVILIDGVATLSGNSGFLGSGVEGSYPFLITTSSCPDDPSCGNSDAISFGGGSGTVALVAQNGTISITGGSALKALTAKKVRMSGGAELFYDSGLVNSNFTSGPGGSWGIVPGTYVIVK